MKKYLIIFSILFVSVFLFCGIATAATNDTNQLSKVTSSVGVTTINHAKLTLTTNQLAKTAWAKFHYNNKNTGQSIYKGPQTTPQQKWKYKTANYAYASGSVIGSDGTVYFGSNNGWENSYLYALTSTGNLKWKYRSSEIVSSPAIADDGTVYFGSRDGYIYALNSSGKLKWKYQTENMRVDSSPAIGTDGTIYIGSGIQLYALNSSGKLKWKYNTNGFVTSSPAIGNGTIYFGSHDSYIYALTSSGNLKWKYLTGYEIYSSPAIADDGTVYIGSRDSYLYAIYSNGKLKWKYKTNSDVFSSPTIAKDGTIYLGNGYLFALTPSGKLKWKYYKADSDPIIGSDGTVYVGFGNTNYLCAITSKGQLKWKYKFNAALNSASVIAKDSTIYISSGEYLYSLKSYPKVISTIPANNAIGVSLTSPIIIKFTENIAAGANYFKIYIKNLTNGKIAPITRFISGNTLIIRMTSIRLHYNTYQVYIPSAAIKDYSGTNLISNYTFRFKSGA
jgi:large repetitive protein